MGNMCIGIKKWAICVLELKRKLCSPFLWMRFNYFKATEPLRGDSILFTANFPEIAGTHSINLKKMKGGVQLGTTQWF